MKTIIILGPTAIGKTDVAIEIAKKINGEIISADSMQIYRLMDIGTAKPTKQQQKIVKHHLIDVKMPNEKFSAGEFAEKARNIISNLKEKNKNALVVGGTGFYVETLVYGIDKIPKVDDKIKLFLDDICDELGTFELFKWLNLVDKEWSKKIHQNDCQRIKRGLSVFLSSKKTISEFLKNSSKINQNENDFIIFVLHSSKEFLKKRIKSRSEKMIENGIIEETKTLLNRGFSNCAPLKSIGYKETLEFIKGEIKTQDELANKISINTLEYAKRQLTFFKSRFRKAYWINVEIYNPIQEILKTITTIHSHLP